MKLYSYWRSTTSYRVRAALNLKGLAYDTVPVDLVAGHQRAPDYAALNAGKGGSCCAATCVAPNRLAAATAAFKVRANLLSIGCSICESEMSLF